MKKLIFATCVLLSVRSSVNACTTFEFGGPGVGGIAHNLDWYSNLSAAAAFFVNARGVDKEGELLGKSDPAAHWTSKYGSLTYTITGREFPAGGRNEAGLSIQALMFSGRYPTPAELNKPALGATQWVQYQLDMSATLDEAIVNAQNIRPQSLQVVHYFVCDYNHNCGVFQYVDGQLKIYSGSTLATPTLTNSPYPESLQSWQDCSAGKCSFPNNSLERFSKAAVARTSFVSGGNPLDLAANVLASVAQSGPITTRYSFADVQSETQSLLYFTVAENWQNWQSLDLNALDFSCAGGGKFLEISSTLTGDQTQKLMPYDESMQKKLAAQMPIPASIQQMLVDYPTHKTKCAVIDGIRKPLR